VHWTGGAAEECRFSGGTCTVSAEFASRARGDRPCRISGRRSGEWRGKGLHYLLWGAKGVKWGGLRGLRGALLQ